MELPRLEIPWTEGDVLPVITGCIEGFDLTGYTVKMNIARPDGEPFEKIAAVDDPASGVFYFPWEDGDLVEGIGQVTTVRLFDGDGDSLTLLRFVLDVGDVPGGEVE